MSFERFTSVTGAAAPLLRSNVDTDVILRVDRLTTTDHGELARYAFEALRYRPEGAEDPGFVLNREPFRSASRGSRSCASGSRPGRRRPRPPNAARRSVELYASEGGSSAPRLLRRITGAGAGDASAFGVPAISGVPSRTSRPLLTTSGTHESIEDEDVSRRRVREPPRS